MFRRFPLLALTLLSGPLVASCQAPAAPAGRISPADRTVSVHLAPTWVTGRFVQTRVNVYTASDVATVDVLPMRRDSDGEYYPLSSTDGATVSLAAANKIMVSVATGELSKGDLVFKNLRPASRCRFQARAIEAAGQVLSVPASSSLDLDLAYEDRPVMARIPIQLVDRGFAATGSILLNQIGTKNFDSVLVELYRFQGQNLVIVPGATASFSDCTGKVFLSNLAPNTRYLAKAQALDVSGTRLDTATASFEVTDDDQVPAVTLHVKGAPVI